MQRAIRYLPRPARRTSPRFRSGGSARRRRFSSIRMMIDIARVADQLNFGYLCLAEHVLVHGHPGIAAHSTGPVRHTPDELMPEPLTTLAAFAGATQRIGLMTGILIAPLRPAALLA